MDPTQTHNTPNVYETGQIFQQPRTHNTKKCSFVIISSLIFILVLVWILNKQMELIREPQPQNVSKMSRKQQKQQINSSNDINEVIKQMRMRPQQKQDGVKHDPKLKATDQAYFAYRLYSQPDNPTFIQAQYSYYNEKYGIQKYGSKQLAMCIISSGRNVVYQNRYVRYLESLSRLNYSNFRVVIVDDFSSDGSAQAIKQYLQLPVMTQLSKKVYIIENSQRLYALYCRDVAIAMHCGVSDIIVQLDLDDQLIGRQSLRVINAVYLHNPEIWVMYSSYIYWSPAYGQPSQGISVQVSASILQSGTYRLTTQYFTSATRTFRKLLYDKIDKTDFISENGSYYKWTSDLFVHYSLVQMAGINHYKYIHEIFYFYYRNHNPYKSTQKAIDRLNALAIRPYKLLHNLNETAQRVDVWETPNWIRQQRMKLYNKLVIPQKLRYL